jgi:hypothetical protein
VEDGENGPMTEQFQFGFLELQTNFIEEAMYCTFSRHKNEL